MIWTSLRQSAAELLAIVCCVFGHAANVARADDIHTPQQTYRDASIRHFDGEFLIFSDTQGKSVARRMSEIDAIYVDSIERLDDFNRAERDYQRQEYREAALKYQKSLGRSRSFWKNLIRVRYLRACDAAGDFDRAVGAYITLAQTMPDKANAFMPGNLDGASTENIKKALHRLEDALPKVSGQAVYWQLEALRLSILELTESDQAEHIAREIITKLQRGSAQGPQYRLQMIAIRVEVRHEQYELALQHVNEALGEAGDEYLPELLFLKGKCWYGQAKDRDQYIRAGLAFMRVIVHFPKSRMCAESMYWAGRVHEKIDRAHKAIELYESCKELPGAGEKVVQLADAAVKRLRTTE